MSRWLICNVAFRLQEWAKGHDTYHFLREMEAADRLTPAALEELQAFGLRRFLDYTWANVPYVRALFDKAGLRPSDVRGPADLGRLPLMRKSDIRNHPEELRSRAAGKLRSTATGGSTGEALIFDISRRRIASHVACRQRVARWWGLGVGDRELALWGSPIELTRQDWRKRLRDKLLGSRLLSAFEMNDATMSRYLDVIEKGKFRQIFAYPSAIYQLCLHARKTGRDLRGAGVKVVFVTSEVLFPFQREIISETLNCPVANGYGGRDAGFIAHECPEGGMHVLADAVIAEILDPDGRAVPPGAPGEIVVTDLYSEETPFLRYATGDVGVLSPNRCSCGRPLPMLERVDGRANDSVVAPDGRIINDQALVYLLRQLEGIEQFKIVQKRVDTFHVQLVRNANFGTEGEERLRNGWSFLFRAPIQVTFEYLPRIAPERSGKFRHVISEVPGARYLQTALADTSPKGRRNK